jgi:surface antigen
VARASNPASAWGTKKWNILSKRVYKSNVSNGFYAWYCTHYVAMITPALFKYTSKTTQERKITGNASNRCSSARANGYSVWSKPAVWAVAVYGPGWGIWWAWHVAKVVNLNSKEGEMTVEEANYLAKWVADRRIESTSNKSIKCYIYPGK